MPLWDEENVRIAFVYDIQIQIFFLFNSFGNSVAHVLFDKVKLNTRWQ